MVREGSVEQEGIELRRVALPGPILISITVRGAEKERFSLITAQRDEQLAEAMGFRAPTRVRALDKHTWTERREIYLSSLALAINLVHQELSLSCLLAWGL